MSGIASFLKDGKAYLLADSAVTEKALPANDNQANSKSAAAHSPRGWPFHAQLLEARARAFTRTYKSGHRGCSISEGAIMKRVPTREDFESWGSGHGRKVATDCLKLRGSGQVLLRGRKSFLANADKIAKQTAASFEKDNGEEFARVYLNAFRTTLAQELKERNVEVAMFGLNWET